jgi:acetyl esterase/lipase
MAQPQVDPELAAMLELFPAFDITAEALPMIRSTPTTEVEPPSTVTVSEHRVPGPEGAPEVRVLVTRAAGQDGMRPVLVWIHGGGYVLGTAEGDQPMMTEIVERIGCVCVSIDYRLAPETPHPGPIEDCYAVLRWVHGKAAELRIDPERIAIGGESAGGGLAAALAILARDRAEVPVVFQVLVYPMLDDRSVTEERDPGAGTYVWTRGSNRFGWTSLLGAEPGAADVSPYAAAARVVDPSGLPPALITVGSLDLFREEDVAYAVRLLAAGVPTTLHVFAGAYHGFTRVPSAVTRRHQAELFEVLGTALATG